MTAPAFSLASSFSWFRSLAAALRARRGWPRAATALLAGALAALAFPPFDAVPVLWLSFPTLIFLLQGTQNLCEAFLTGWCFAFGFGVLSFYWIAGALFVDIGHFWWVLPFAVAGLPAVLAVYYGLAAALARKIGLGGIAGAVTLALFWFLADYARGHLFTGCPWDIFGYVWADFLPALQITSIAGIYGLTLLTLVIVCLPACLADNTWRARYAVGSSLIFLVLLLVWGTWRAEASPASYFPDVRLRLVQPATNQRLKWQTERREVNFQHILQLSAAPAEKPVTDIIWPETAATFYLTEDSVHRNEIAALVPSAGAVITGVIRRAQDEFGLIHYYNSLIAIDGRGRVIAGYDKFHLVPFGEYVPFRKYLPMRALTALGVDFSTGDGLRTLRMLGLPAFSPLICYEAIFPGEVADHSDLPQFLLNLTNDGWYAHTTGPYQHFAIARVRAIEEGLPLVRAANRGVNAVIDPYGRIEAKLGWEKEGFIDSDLPKPLASPTIFSRIGDQPMWILFALLAVAIIGIKLKSLKV